MFKNPDSGLGNFYIWFVPQGQESMDNFHVVLKVKLKRIQKLLTAVSGPHKRGNRHVYLNFCWYLRLPLRLWLLNFQ